MASESSNFRHIVRIVNTDIDGKQKLVGGLRNIKGIGFMFSNMVCSLASISKGRVIGELTDKEVSTINDILKSPFKYNIPRWMLNRRKDPEEAKDSHLLSSDVKFVQENDIKQLKKIKCYKGIRHIQKLPVRGQRTKAHFRNKGKNKALGVKKAKGNKKGK